MLQCGFVRSNLAFAILRLFFLENRAARPMRARP
jgi:hypothetical protein